MTILYRSYSSSDPDPDPLKTVMFVWMFVYNYWTDLKLLVVTELLLTCYSLVVVVAARNNRRKKMDFNLDMHQIIHIYQPSKYFQLKKSTGLVDSSLMRGFSAVNTK